MAASDRLPAALLATDDPGHPGAVALNRVGTGLPPRDRAVARLGHESRESRFPRHARVAAGWRLFAPGRLLGRAIVPSLLHWRAHRLRPAHLALSPASTIVARLLRQTAGWRRGVATDERRDPDARDVDHEPDVAAEHDADLDRFDRH